MTFYRQVFRATDSVPKDLVRALQSFSCSFRADSVARPRYEVEVDTFITRDLLTWRTAPDATAADRRLLVLHRDADDALVAVSAYESEMRQWDNMMNAVRYIQVLAVSANLRSPNPTLRIGSQFLATVIDQIRSDEDATVAVGAYVHRHNEPARSLFRSQNFQERRLPEANGYSYWIVGL